MAKCDCCGTNIWLGGVKEGNRRFCNDECQGRALLLRYTDQLDPEQVEAFIRTTHQGRCPRCQGPGPVDVHTSHRVYSVLVVTNWGSSPQICCAKCGAWAKVRDLVVSLFLGWWGFPWGLIMTPVQLVRNIVGLLTRQDPLRPSDQLRTQLTLHLAAQLVTAEQLKYPELPG